jgi:hemerythrin
VVIEFPTFEQAVACFESPEYQEAAALRRNGGGVVGDVIGGGGDATTGAGGRRAPAAVTRGPDAPRQRLQLQLQHDRRRGTSVKWSERFATGVAYIDEQHRLLFQMSETYRDAVTHREGERTYGFVLEWFEQYSRAHFGQEEECMERYRCPAAAANKEAHAAFSAAIAGFQQRFSRDGFDPADAQRLVDFVDHWLASHIARIDTQLKPCVDGVEGC